MSFFVSETAQLIEVVNYCFRQTGLCIEKTDNAPDSNTFVVVMLQCDYVVDDKRIGLAKERIENMSSLALIPVSVKIVKSYKPVKDRTVIELSGGKKNKRKTTMKKIRLMIFITDLRD